MSSRFLAAVMIGGLCVAAAGGGAYLAVKQQAQAAPDATATQGRVDEATATAAEQVAAPAPIESPIISPPPADDVRTPAAPRPAQRAAMPAQAAPAARPAPGARPTDVASAAPAGTSASATPDAPEAPAADSSTVTEPAPLPQASSPYVPSRPTIEPPAAEPAAPSAANDSTPGFEELHIPADAVIGVQIDRTISSDFARIEDRVDGRITRDVRVAGQVAIPAGSRVRGSVTMVEQGGKFKTRARLGVRFDTVLLADGSSIPIQTETVFREGASPAGDARAKISGGAVGGAIIGAILGGRKGAALGGSLGAGAGTAAVAAGDTNPATLPSGMAVTVRLSRPATVTIEKH